MIIFSIPLVEMFKNISELTTKVYIFDKYFYNIFIIIKNWVIYCLTVFQDFVFFPINLPFTFNNFFFDYPGSEYLSIELKPNFENNHYFLLGFLNCIFLYLQFSPVQLLWLRYVIVDRIKIAASLGLILGNLSFLACFFFGLREIIFSWFGLEPITYFIGVYVTLFVIYKVAHKPLKLKNEINKKFKLKEFTQICLIEFFLIWTDQPHFFPFFSNLNFNNEISFFDNEQRFYFLGFIAGNLFWPFFISNIILLFTIIFPRIMGIKLFYWKKGLNYFFLVLPISIMLASFQYYSPEYLLTGPLGIIPEDKIWDKIPNIALNVETKDTKKGRLGDKSSFESTDTDLSFFDKSRYAGGPVIEYHLESLNYKEEYAWRSRIDRVSLKRRTQSFLSRLIKNKSVFAKKFALYERKKKRLKKEFKFIQKVKRRENFIFKKRDVKPRYLLGRFKNYQINTLIERFVENYNAEGNFEDKEVPNLETDKMIYFSALAEIDRYGFDAFSIFEPVEIDPFDEELQKEMKRRYSTNAFNRLLLYLDIPNFLQRQSDNLDSQEEIDIFKKRQALEKYYNTLRDYKDIPKNFIFNLFFCENKSYTNRIYNQQFKGTFKILERLFSIHLEKEQYIPVLIVTDETEAILANSKNTFEERIYLQLKKDSSVVKFDQPLYKRYSLKKNPLLHEQLLEDTNSDSDSDSNDKLPSITLDNLNFTLPFIKQNDLNFSLPFITEEQPIPFFVGWDGRKHKFVLSNRLLLKKKSLTKINFVQKKFRYWKNDLNRFNFYIWPVSKRKLKTNELLNRSYRTQNQISAVDDVFEYMEPMMEDIAMIYDSLPSIVKRIELKSQERLELLLKPTLGGVFWSGTEIKKK
uniref:Ycf1 n=1 Tax=Callipsygma wilsonis TaxID=2320807 RepID=A0A386AZV3_9CHLO|nr:hypothetical protein Ycf1 [Callipsygma wilsonis]AYC64976.1 hypothetical protein Ycf1 [Callipsygma wilsonis]